VPSSGDYGGREGVLGKGVGQDFDSPRCAGVEEESGGLAKEGDSKLAGKERISWGKSGGGGGGAKALGGRKNGGLAGARGWTGAEIRKQAVLVSWEGVGLLNPKRGDTFLFPSYGDSSIQSP